MEPIAIPLSIDDPIHILLWSTYEIVPYMVSMLTGILIDQFHVNQRAKLTRASALPNQDYFL